MGTKPTRATGEEENIAKLGLKSAIQSNREQRLVEKQSLEKFPGTAARLCLKDGSDSREGRQRGAPAPS